MGARLPLVRVAGRFQQLPAGDYVPVVAGGTGATDAAGARDALGITTALSVKVDKVVGKQLSTEDYSTAEKSKLAGLDPNHFRGMFATLAALQAAVPAANIGDYAFVDPASGADVIQYLWDSNDGKWVYNGPTAGVTAAQVKTLYESNPNTNAFTDADKSKLGGIAPGAQVNLVTSVAGRNGEVLLAKGDVGLGNVDNLSALALRRSWNGGFNRYTTSQTLTAAQVGSVIWFLTAGLTCTLPTPSTMGVGQGFTIRNATSGNLTVTTPSGSIYPELDNLNGPSVVLGPKEWIEIGTDGSNWTINLRGLLEKAAPLANPTFSGTANFSGNSIVLNPVAGGNMGMEIGYTGSAATTPFIDFHSSGFPTDYDARLLASGGNSTPGAGTLSVYAAAFTTLCPFTSTGDISVAGTTGEPKVRINGNAATNRYLRLDTGNTQRWQVGASAASESGSNVGSNFYINRFDDAGAYLSSPMTIDRASGDIQLSGKVQTTGPFKPGSYTTTTLPSAALFNGYMILVTNAQGGAKYCVSNGTVWQLINTTTTVS